MNRTFLKQRKYTVTTLLIAGLILVINSCGKDPDTNVAPQSIAFHVPEGWPVPQYLFENNTLSTGGFELGRKIFYDTRLSKDNTISCGSCHQSFAAFANLDHTVSHGINSLVGTRNSPGLANLAWSPTFFWDGGVLNLENQPLAPIQNVVEMDLKIDSVVARLNADPVYRDQFRNVFGDGSITSQTIFRAIAQFMAVMVSSNSRYDRAMRKEGGVVLSPSETAGLALYQQHCAACHKAPLFTDYSFRNNGLAVTAVNDIGRAMITLLEGDRYKFKVPSLRNLGFTRPYMHDGRFSTLTQVLDHYDHGVVPSATLDPILQKPINLNLQERTDLLAFLGSLNDSSFVADQRFHDPGP